MAARVLGLFLLCAALCSGFAVALAPQPIVLNDRARVISLTAGAQVLKDPQQQYSIDDVARGDAKFAAASTVPNDYAISTRWYRFEVRNDARAGVRWYVSASPYGQSAELYYPKSATRYGVVRFGPDIPFAQRPARGELPAVPLAASMFGKPLYLRVTGDFAPGSVPAIHREGTLDPFDRASAGALIGFLFAMCLASLLLAMRLRSNLHYWTAAWLFVAAFNEVTSRLLAPEYLWPTSELPLRLVNNIANAGVYVLLYLQARSFLKAPYRPKWFDAAVVPELVLIAACGLLRAAEPVPALAAGIGIAVLLLGIALTSAAAVALYRGYRAARFFLLGVGLFCLFEDLQILSLTGVPLPPIFQWLPPLGVAFYALILQLALADRILLMSDERKDALTQLAGERQNVIRTQQETLHKLESHNRAVSRFVPADFLRRLGSDDVENLQLGDHVEREMAVLFCDIRSFTTISERLTPQENFDFVNGYFSRVGPIVRAHGGFIDKFVGDAVMALFDEPKQALDAAIALQQEVRRFNEARARQFLQPIEVGVGIHFGPLMLGTVGEEHRMDTTVISSAVNVASRMESLTKRYGASILVTEALLEKLADRTQYNARCLGSVEVRGLARSVAVYEICDADVPELMLAKIGRAGDFAAAMLAFESGNTTVAQTLFESITQMEPRDGASRYYLERIRLQNAGAHMPL